MMYGNIENMDVFKVMELVGIDDKKHCLNLIQYARYQVKKDKA